MKKRISLAIILCLILCCSLSLAACNNDTSTTTPTKLIMGALSYDDTTKIVSWDKVANASGYTLKVGAIEKTSIIESGNKMQYVMSESASGTYTVSVVAKGDGTNYINSDSEIKDIAYIKADTTATVPQAPQSFQAQAGNGQVVLSWSAPLSDGGSAITGYQVSSDNGSNWITASSNTGHTFTSLTNDTLYTFKIRAVNSIGSGTAATASATPTAALTAPSAPQNFQAQAGDSQVVLSWSAPLSDGGSAITGYQVSSDNGSTWTAANSGTGHTFTSLTNGTLYTFKVRAVNSIGSGTAATTTAMPESTQPDNMLEAPENVRIEFPSTLRWDAGLFCSGYKVKIDGNIVSTISNKNTTTYTISTTYNSTHSVSVQATGDGTEFLDSPFSNPITYVYGRLAAPASIVVNRSLYTLTFNRVGGTNPAASNVKEYLLLANDDLQFTISAATTTTVTFDLKQLIKIDVYSLKVKTIALDIEERDSEWSAEAEYIFDDFASGSGTIVEPYILTNTTHISKITNFNDKHFMLANNIDFAPLSAWSAICTETNGFAGVLDGNNKKLLGYKFNNLFGNIAESGTVKNLEITLVDDFSDIYAYAILAGTNYGTIKNVSVVGNSVVGDNSNNEFEIQSLFVGNNALTGIISGCSVKLNSLSLINTVGMGFGAIANTNDGTIDNSFVNIGSFTISSSRTYTYDSSSETGRYYYIGGIVSQNAGILDFCNVQANVTLSGLSGNFYYFGMLAGVNGDKIDRFYDSNGIIQNSYSSGTINASSAGGGEKFIVGGLAALNSKNIKISYSTVTITVAANGNRGFSIGGIAGESSDYYRGSYIDCYFAGSIVLTNNDTSVTGQIGGFIGRERVNANTYTRCLVYGAISITGSGATTRTQRGAFCGYAQSPSGSNNYYDSETTNGLNAAGGGTASIFTARSTAQMTDSANWTAFSEAWTVREGQYPGLKLINPKMPVISGPTDISTKINNPVDLLQGVSAVDAESNPIEVIVSDVDFSVAGSVSVTYTAIDAEGYTSTVTITLKIYGLPDISGAENKNVEISRTGIFDPLAGITSVDTFGNPLIVTSNYSSLDLTTTGTKILIFYATDSMGNTTEISVQLTVYKNPIVTFDAGDGTCVTETLTVELGESIASIPIPTRKGYEFLYWELPNGDPLDTSYSVTADLTVVAVWQERYYYTIFNTGAGGNSISGNSVLYSDLINEILSKTAYNGNGYFEGWYFDAGFTKEVNLENFSDINTGVYVYAKYNATVKVRFFDIEDSLIAEYDLPYGGNLYTLAYDAISTGSHQESAETFYSFWSLTQGREAFLPQNYLHDMLIHGDMTITAATDFYRVEAFRLTLVDGYNNYGLMQIARGETINSALTRYAKYYLFAGENRWYFDEAFTVPFLSSDLDTTASEDVILYCAQYAVANVYGANDENVGYFYGYTDETVAEVLERYPTLKELLAQDEWFFDSDRTIPFNKNARMTAGMTIYKQQPVRVTLMEWMGDRFALGQIIEFEKDGTFRQGYNSFYNKEFIDQNVWYIDEARTQLFTAAMWDAAYSANFSLYKGDPIYIYVYYYNGTTDVLFKSIMVYANETYLEAIERTYNNYEDWYTDASRATAVTSNMLNAFPTLSLSVYAVRYFNLTIYDVYFDGTEYQTRVALTLYSVRENITFSELSLEQLDSMNEHNLSLADLYTDLEGTTALGGGKFVFGMALYVKESVPIYLIYANPIGQQPFVLVRQGETLRQAATRSMYDVIYYQWFVDQERTTLFNQSNLDQTVSVPFTLYQVISYGVVFSTVNFYGGSHDLGITVYEYETLGEAVAKSAAAQNWLSSKAGRIYLDSGLTQSYSADLLTEYLTKSMTFYTPQLFGVDLYDNMGLMIGAGRVEIYLNETLNEAVARSSANATLLGDGIWYLQSTATEAVDMDAKYSVSYNFTQLYLKRNPFTITFDTDGGTVIAPVTLDYGQSYELPVAEKNGYMFVGWTRVKGDINTILYNLSNETESRTFYAFYQEIGDNSGILGIWSASIGSGVAYCFNADNTVERYWLNMPYLQEENNIVQYAFFEGMLYCEWFSSPLRLEIDAEGGTYVLVDSNNYSNNCYKYGDTVAIVIIINEITDSVLGVVLSEGSTVGDLEFISGAKFFYNELPWDVNDKITTDMLGKFNIITIKQIN